MPEKIKKPSGVRLSTLQNATSAVAVEWDGETYNLKFKRGFWTPSLEQAYIEGESRFTQKNIDVLLNALVSWDILDDEDKMVPITREVMLQLDLYLLDAMVTAMIRKVNPNTANSQD